MAHTPGPWHDTSLPIKWGTRYINEENGFAIARVFMRQDRRVSNKAVIAEMLANAQLIEAAPDLLAALEAVIPDIERVVARSGPGPDSRLAHALNAIDKAKGS